MKGDFDIINLGAAAVLQAKLPNPIWMRGTVGGYYSILGGLVSGQCKFEMTLGEQCQLNGGSAVTGLKIIAELSPAANERKVNVFNAPQAAFNIPVSKIFELVDLDDQKKSFRVALDHFNVSEGGTEIQGKEEWNANNDVVAFKSFEILPPKKTLKISVKVHFEESVNGSWRPVLVNGKTVEELKENTFETGEAPDFIPASNVTYSYPCLNQYNFHKDESTQGYMQLARGQSYLFSPSSEWKQVGRFQSGNVKHEFNFSYNVSERKIAFAIPSGLSNESIYTYQLLNVPAAANSKVDANVKTVVKGESDVLISTKDVEGTLNLLEEKPIFSSHIKTSKFNTFQSKISSLGNGPGWIWDILTGVNELGTNLSTPEYFDKYEVQGTNTTKPLIQYEAVLDNKWYTKEVYPLVYQEYPLGGNLAITWRKTDSLGIPPIRSIYLRQTPPDKILVENEIESRSFSPFSNYAAFVYDLSFITYKDYHELRQKASVAIKDNRGNNAMSKLVASYYPILGSGKYRFKVRYVLPGTDKVTSEKEFTIVKP